MHTARQAEVVLGKKPRIDAGCDGALCVFDKKNFKPDDQPIINSYSLLIWLDYKPDTLLYMLEECWFFLATHQNIIGNKLRLNNDSCLSALRSND